jgi:hypothetical protein
MVSLTKNHLPRERKVVVLPRFNLGELSCKNSRWAAGAPPVVEPAAAPAPTTTVPAQAQDVAVAALDPKDCSIEVDERRSAVRQLLKTFRNQVLVLPEGLENPSIETDVPGDLETRELLFALNALLAVIEHRLEPNKCEVDIVESETALILFLDRPPIADELGGVERCCSVNHHNLR